MADLAGPRKTKKRKKRTKKPRNLTGDEIHYPWREEMPKNYSCASFNLEDVQEKPEKNQKPTMVHPENS